MLSVYVPRGTSLERIPIEPSAAPPEAAVWIDLVTPTVQEDKVVEQLLGIVSIQQNDIIKIFSIAAVVFMPPTLVASIYGMNFHHNMIELDWEFGYPFAILLMVLVAVLPLLVFKWMKWL